MARISLTPHRKFRRLARALGSAALARGVLELLWETAYEAAAAFVGNAEDVADAVGWREDPSALVALLRDTGFLDPVGADGWAVHDLWDHAPKYVRQRWERAHPGAARPWDLSTCVPESGPGGTESGPPVDRTRPAEGSIKKEQQRAGARRAPDPPNVNVLTRLGYDLPLHAPELVDESDRKEALKELAVRFGLTYDATSVSQALDNVARGRRALWITDPRPHARRRRVS